MAFRKERDAQRARGEAIEQNGAQMVRRPKPDRVEFIRAWVDKYGSFRGDGRARNADYTAALKLLAADKRLELVTDDSVVGNKAVPGWKLQRRGR